MNKEQGLDIAPATLLPTFSTFSTQVSQLVHVQLFIPSNESVTHIHGLCSDAYITY